MPYVIIYLSNILGVCSTALESIVTNTSNVKMNLSPIVYTSELIPIIIINLKFVKYHEN